MLWGTEARERHPWLCYKHGLSPGSPRCRSGFSEIKFSEGGKKPLLGPFVLLSHGRVCSLVVFPLLSVKLGALWLRPNYSYPYKKGL